MGADGEECGVFAAEDGYDLWGKQVSKYRQDCEQAGSGDEGEEVGLLHSFIEVCPIVETADGLKPLGESQYEGVGEHGGARHHGEGSDR